MELKIPITLKTARIKLWGWLNQPNLGGEDELSKGKPPNSSYPSKKAKSWKGSTWFSKMA